MTSAQMATYRLILRQMSLSANVLINRFMLYSMPNLRNPYD